MHSKNDNENAIVAFHFGTTGADAPTVMRLPIDTAQSKLLPGTGEKRFQRVCCLDYYERMLGKKIKENDPHVAIKRQTISAWRAHSH